MYNVHIMYVVTKLERIIIQGGQSIMLFFSAYTANLRSCEYSNFDELCMHKIHYKTMILYLNYKNNVYKVENLNEKSGR